MNKGTLFIFILLVVIVGVGAFLYYRTDMFTNLMVEPRVEPLTEEEKFDVLNSLSVSSSTDSTSLSDKEKKSVLDTLAGPSASSTATSSGSSGGISEEEKIRILKSLEAK